MKRSETTDPDEIYQQFLDEDLKDLEEKESDIIRSLNYCDFTKDHKKVGKKLYVVTGGAFTKINIRKSYDCNVCERNQEIPDGDLERFIKEKSSEESTIGFIPCPPVEFRDNFNVKTLRKLGFRWTEEGKRIHIGNNKWYLAVIYQKSA